MKWLSNDTDPTTMFEAGMIVKGGGVASFYKDKISVNIESLDAIEDHNVLLHHFLDVILTRHRLKDRVNNFKSETMDFKGQNQSLGGHSNMYGHGMGKPISVSHENHGHAGGSGFDSLTEEVRKVFNDDKENEAGLSVYEVHLEISKRCRGSNFSEDMVRQVIFMLSDDGHLYSTSDDEHFRST